MLKRFPQRQKIRRAQRTTDAKRKYCKENLEFIRFLTESWKFKLKIFFVF